MTLIGPGPSRHRTATMTMQTTTQAGDLLARTDEVCAQVVSNHAVEVDGNARFPEESIAALGEAGLLGLVSHRDVGGQGAPPSVASAVIARIAAACGSTAMITCMHYCGAAVIERHGPEELRRQVAMGVHLSTLAFSETGSRSQFWAPVSTASADGDSVILDAEKSWVTAAHQATAYVWSSRPVDAEGASTLWLVPRAADGLAVIGNFAGLGLRGNDSSPVTAKGVRLPASARLGEDGRGFGIMMETVLPLFSLLNASCSLGLMEAAVTATCEHAKGTRFTHTESALRELPTIRNYIARMRVQTDMVAALLADCCAAMESGREDAMLRVLESKAGAGEVANRVLDLAMRVCGGAAYRREVGVERRFRDGRAAGIMAPTTDVLYDFIGKTVTGMELFSS